MAGSDPQKQLFTLIRDYSTEKSQGERRIVNQKKRIDELRSEVDASITELQECKRHKETTEQHLKGYEVELSMNEASIQALEARISLTNNEILELGSELTNLKSEENSLRDGFIGKMLDLNAHIRKFLDFLASTCIVENRSEATSNDSSLTAHERDDQQARVVLQNKLAEIVIRADQKEEQYEAELGIHDQVEQELRNLKRKELLLESVMKESMELQEMSKQTAELEGKCAALGDELQKRFLCPRCHQDNSEELGEILQICNGA